MGGRGGRFDFCEGFLFKCLTQSPRIWAKSGQIPPLCDCFVFKHKNDMTAREDGKDGKMDDVNNMNMKISKCY